MKIIDNSAAVATPLNSELATSCLFRRLRPEQASALRRDMWFHTYAHAEPVFEAGDAGDRLQIIRTGRVKVSRPLADGTPYLLAVLGPGDLLGVLPGLDTGPREETAIAVTHVTTGSLPYSVLRKWCIVVPTVGLELARERQDRLRELEQRRIDQVRLDAPGRLAKLLLGWADRFGTADGDTITVDHRLTQRELGELIGTSRETVCLAMRQFVTRGWIRNTDRGVRVLHRAELARRAR
ncbi:Crp/Fnr family transcriptional regulator [Crossiella cryophila]|uniref:CRP-like cAMP-binding protein n=1 Tax=Crossiella cryophila TaxID=43355 RepID=A0A7W7CIC8_9PSEU|nr:Crp/Fnr family transcriptional regulator [Crossiella cryophila]MBB4681822.1 CRP-like cAMP-binding protein [Crossiella cryophila]